jgi:hypothetical protein
LKSTSWKKYWIVICQIKNFFIDQNHKMEEWSLYLFLLLVFSYLYLFSLVRLDLERTTSISTAFEREVIHFNFAIETLQLRIITST